MAAALNVNAPLPEPDARLTVNHDTLEDTRHDVFDDTDTDVDDAAATGLQLDADNANAGTVVATPPACETVTVAYICGLPDVVISVTDPDRDADPVFADALNVNVPFPEPDDGLTVTHDGVN